MRNKKPNPDMLEQMLEIKGEPRDVDELWGNVKTPKQIKSGEKSSVTIISKDGKTIAVPSKAELKSAEKALRMQHQRNGLDLLDPALNVVKELLDSEKDGIRLAAAKDIQDRFGGKSTTIRHEIAQAQIGPTIIFRGVNRYSHKATLDEVEMMIDGDTGKIIEPDEDE